MSELWKALGRIPDVTYDLMSRIIPGGIVLAGLVKWLCLPVPWDQLQITVFLVLAYLVGLGVSTIASVVGNNVAWVLVVKWMVDSHAYGTIARALKEAEQNAPWSPLPGMRLMGRAHDRMGLSEEWQHKKAIGTKLFAEVALLYSMAGSLAIVGLLISWKDGFIWICSGVFFIAGVFRSWRTWERFANFVEGQDLSV